MKASTCEVIDTYTITRNGQVCTVKVYEPTKAEKIEKDHSNLSFHRRHERRLNGASVRQYLRSGCNET